MADKSALARTLRRNQTRAENRFWNQVRNRQLRGYKFRRQVPLGKYVADFVCQDKKVIVELDGGQHAEQAEQDLKRTRGLEQLGYQVIRYWNNDVLENMEGVLTNLLEELER